MRDGWKEWMGNGSGVRCMHHRVYIDRQTAEKPKSAEEQNMRAWQIGSSSMIRATNDPTDNRKHSPVEAREEWQTQLKHRQIRTVHDLDFQFGRQMADRQSTTDLGVHDLGDK